MNRLVFGLVSSLGVLATGCSTWQEVVRDQGYRPLAAPNSRLPELGSVIFIRNVRSDHVAWDPVCTQAEYYGGVPSSQTGIGADSSVNSTFAAKASAELREIASGNASADWKWSVNVTNTTQELLSRATLHGAKPSKDCVAEAVKAQKKGGWLAVVQGLWRADVVATNGGQVSGAASGGPTAAAAQAFKLDAKFEVTGQNTVTGKGLIWGFSYLEMDPLAADATPANLVPRETIPEPTWVYLSDFAKTDTDPSNIHGSLQKDRVYWQPTIMIDGTVYAKGLGMHAPEKGVGYVEYKLNKSFTKFEAAIGLAEDSKNDYCPKNGFGSARFRVLGDGRELVAWKLYKNFHSHEKVSVDVGGVSVLRLEVDNGGNDNGCDHSAWGDARVLRAAQSTSPAIPSSDLSVPPPIPPQRGGCGGCRLAQQSTFDEPAGLASLTLALLILTRRKGRTSG